MKPSTLLRLHRALTKRKYRQLFSSGVSKKPGPKGPTQDVMAAVVDMKQRNPTWGCPRIAHQIALAFGIPIDKDVVRRILAVRHQPEPDSCGPSWLTFLGHAKDSLWSIDLFRCESTILRSHSVLVVMDQCTRRIVGFGIHAGIVDGRALCCMFNHATRGHATPKYLSSDNDPLYRFYQWQANLRVRCVSEVKSVPYVPMSHPFVERLIGTLRRECLDRILFWSASADGKVDGTRFRDSNPRMGSYVIRSKGLSPARGRGSRRCNLRLLEDCCLGWQSPSDNPHRGSVMQGLVAHVKALQNQEIGGV